MNLAAALSTDWSPSKRHAGKQAVTVVHLGSAKSCESRLRSHKKQGLDAAPDEVDAELAEAAADRSRDMDRPVSYNDRTQPDHVTGLQLYIEQSVELYIICRRQSLAG